MISLHCIVKNESAILSTMLRSVRDYVEEMIVVDTGSSDDTVAIAEAHGARVERFDWVDDFAAARNYALSFVRTPWAIWLDADDLLLNAQLIPEIIEQARKKRINSLWSVYKQDETCHQRRLQIFKTRDYQWRGYVHENPIPRNRSLAYGALSDLIVLHRKPHDRRPEAAKKYLDILLAKDPENWLGLAESCRYLALCTEGEEQHAYKVQAEEYYWRAANMQDANEPTKYVALFHAANLNVELAKRAQDPEGLQVAIKLVECLLGMAPRRAEGLVMAGQIAEAFGAKVDAAQYYRKALSCKRPDDIGLVFGDYYDKLPRVLLSRLEAA